MGNEIQTRNYNERMLQYEYGDIENDRVVCQTDKNEYTGVREGHALPDLKRQLNWIAFRELSADWKTN